ncbi:BPSL0761 family protein [Pseudomonas sp. NPDC086581]|uniref:BPSL0761 family protein n=1 Tax=Pseudomonas sp. NPDC086581 TaxID=3364432 RepID=UPI003811EC8B
MPHERSRAVIQAREFLIEISRNATLPSKIRSDAKFLLRHYPSADQVLLAGRIEEASLDSGRGLAPVLGPIFSSSTTESP